MADDKDDADKTVFGQKLPDPSATPTDTPPKDRTIIGGALPPPQPGPQKPQPRTEARPDPEPGSRTVIGGALPPASPPAASAVPDATRTVIGGPLPPQPSAAPTTPAQAPVERTVIGGALPQEPAPPRKPAGNEPDVEQRTVIGEALPPQTPPARPSTPASPRAAPTAPQSDGQTVIGGALPPQVPPERSAPTAPEGDGRTVIGGALPPQPSPKPAPPSPKPAAPERIERTVIGAAMPPQAPAPRAPDPAVQDQRTVIGSTPPPQTAPERTVVGGAPPGAVPAQTPPGAAPAHTVTAFGGHPSGTDANAGRIPLRAALGTDGNATGAGASGNPLLAAATGLLTLFGRLRTGMVDMQAAPLLDHITREIDMFERNAVAAGADAHDALVGKYALCGTTDDIVQNLPGADRGYWAQNAMVMRFFGKPDSGVGFFQEAEKAMQAPGQRYNLLELMLVCLNLGFEGQYRNSPHAASDLARIRAVIYDRLRRARPRTLSDLSANWAPVPLGQGRQTRLPFWALIGLAAAAVVAFYATLSTMINQNGSDVAQYLYAMHPTRAGVQLERAPSPVFVAEATQLERMLDGLGPDIDAGLVEVSQVGDFITLRMGNQMVFDVGAASVTPDFSPLSSRITDVLNAEQGPIIVQGFTDSLGAFNTNIALSVERAESVAGVLRATLDDPSRVAVEGRGEQEPIADNSTEEGRALNRRVEIKLIREGSF